METEESKEEEKPKKMNKQKKEGKGKEEEMHRFWPAEMHASVSI